MADKTSVVGQVGEPLGALTLSGTRKQWLFSVPDRASADIQLIAIDPVSGNAVDFKYSLSSAGEEFIIPGGSGIKLPVYDGQSLYVRQNIFAAPSLEVSVVG